MTTMLAERIWPACLSALQLDRLLAGELSASEAREVETHLAACARCSEAAASLRAGRNEPLPPLKVVPLRRPLWPRIAAATAALAAAASLLLVLRPSGERIKGSGFALEMYIQHGSEVRRAGPGETVAPGDALRFAVIAPVESYVAVLSLDPEGRSSIYFPLGPRAERIPAGADVPLPLSTRLDATIGKERIVALFCRSPIDLEPVRAHSDRVPDGCQVVRWEFVKR
jgi:hypothetical protein